MASASVSRARSLEPFPFPQKRKSLYLVELTRFPARLRALPTLAERAPEPVPTATETAIDVAMSAKPLAEENVNAGAPASYAPTWYTATMVPAPARAPLSYDLDVDVCVIGAGLAGLTAARELARRGWSVAVLERDRVAWNASGRNDGFVLPGFAASMDRLT